MDVSRATCRQAASLSALALGVAGAAVLFSPATVLDSLTSLSDRPLVFLAVMGGLYLVRPFVLWPVSVLSATVGFVLGVAYGLPVATAGLLVSSTIPFLLARRFRTDAGVLGVAMRTSDRVAATTGEVRGIVAARLAPIPSDAVSTAAGLSEVSFGRYLFGTLVGESPWIVGAVVAGASMRTLSVDGLGHGLAFVAGAASLSALLLAGPLYRRIRHRSGRST